MVTGGARAATGLAAHLVYVTDPLCSGCWALEPAWRRLVGRYPNASIAYVYGGLLPSWDGFSDRAAGITSPADVAPHWDAVAEASGQPIDSRVWITDPPASSFPACIAAIAVRLVVPEQEGRYLRRLRELVFLEGRNIARTEVLREALRSVEVDADAWSVVIHSGAAARLFEADRARARRLGARAFPTVFIETADGQLHVIARHASSPAAFEAAARDVASALLGPPVVPASVAGVLDEYGTATTAELTAATGLSAQVVDNDLTVAGAQRRDLAPGTVWQR
jgi:putative protein-disulfide isomerase